jgi:hypothetical protein
VHEYLSASARSAFANLSSTAFSSAMHRSAADAPGGFTKKTIGGQVYWYHQVKLADGKQQQTYIGKASEEIDRLIAAHQDPSSQATKSHLRKLCASAIVLGCREVPAKHAMVIDRLIDFGFFRAGGILVGTHCFMAYENMFGIRWGTGAQTLDHLDFAHPGKNVSLAIPPGPVDTHGAIETLKMGFAPNNNRTTYRKADEPDFDLDFLTSIGRDGESPVLVKALNVSLQPLRFMEFSMVSTTQAVLLARRGPLVVTIPAPERYAVHKLLVYGERPEKQRTKANKDLAQSASLISYLTENDPEALREAWQDLNARGPGWRRRASEGLEAIRHRYPTLNVDLLAEIKPAAAPIPRTDAS